MTRKPSSTTAKSLIEVAGPKPAVVVPHYSPDYAAGWAAALEAASLWLQAQAKQAMIQSTRTRFPKNLEREAEVHTRVAERITALSPDDV
jgi:hypothetical protein